MKNYTIYLRVSTRRQGASHLGLDAQKDMCRRYIESVGGNIDKVFKDVESGKSRERRGLWEAIEHCKRNGSTLVIAKLDRLARDVEFTFKVMNTGIKIHFVDMPIVNTMILGVFASVAQYERELISSRTKAGLQAKKLRDGSWADQWGKNTGTTREQACEKARAAMSKNRREKAMAHPANRAFYDYVCLYEQRNGKIKSDTNIDTLVDELNRLRYKTATGLEFNSNRCRAMLTKTKLMYAKI